MSTCPQPGCGHVALLEGGYHLSTCPQVRGCGHVALLEGGYHVEASAACAEAVLAEMRSPRYSPRYSPRIIAEMIAQVLAVMIDHPYHELAPADADADAAAASLGTCAVHTPELLRGLIEAHGEFWPCLVSEAHRARVDTFFSRRRPRVRRERSAPEPPKARKKHAGRDASV